MHKKLVPEPCFILANNPKQPLHAKISFENRIYYILKEDYHKVLKQLTLLFLLNPSFLMDKVIKKGAWN